MYHSTASNKQDIIQHQSQNDVNELISKNYVFDPQMLRDLHKQLCNASNNTSSDPAVALYYYYAFDALRNYFNKLWNEGKLIPEFESAFHDISTLALPDFYTIQTRFIQSYLTQSPVIPKTKKISSILGNYQQAWYKRKSIPTSNYPAMGILQPIMKESPFQSSQYTPGMVTTNQSLQSTYTPSPVPQVSVYNSSTSQPVLRQISGPEIFRSSMAAPPNQNMFGRQTNSYPGNSPRSRNSADLYEILAANTYGYSTNTLQSTPSFDRIPTLPQGSCYGQVQPPIMACGDLTSSGYNVRRNSGSVFMSNDSLRSKYNLDEIPEYEKLKFGYFDPSNMEKMEMKAK